MIDRTLAVAERENQRMGGASRLARAWRCAPAR